MRKLILLVIFIITTSYKDMSKENEKAILDNQKNSNNISFDYTKEITEIQENLNSAKEDLKIADSLTSDKRKIRKIKRKLKND